MRMRSCCQFSSRSKAGCADWTSFASIGLILVLGDGADAAERHVIGVTAACSVSRRTLDDVLVIAAASLQAENTLGFQLPQDGENRLLGGLHFPNLDWP